MFPRLGIYKIFCLASLVSIFFGVASRHVHGGDVVLKNGMKFEGDPVPIVAMSERIAKQNPNVFKILMVSTGIKWYFVPQSSLSSYNRNADLGRNVTFTLKQPRRRPKAALGRLGAMFEISKFSRFGRRTAKIRDGQKTIDVVQGVVKITPQHLLLRGLTHQWDQGIATTSVPLDQLDAMIRQATDGKNPDDRMAIARFYLQASYFPQAEEEIRSIIRDFPTLKVRAEKVKKQLHNFQTKRILTELKNRQNVGQDALVQNSLKLLKKRKNLDLSLKREIELMSDGYEVSKKKIAETKKLLGTMKTKIEGDRPFQTRVGATVDKIANSLNFESVALLDAFSKLSVSKNLNTNQKVALAISGWCLGSENALTDLKLSLRLWEARKTVVEYLGESDKIQRQLLLGRLKAVEGVGPRVVRKMIPYLPMALNSPTATLEKSFVVKFGGNRSEMKYTVKLPPEYRPSRRYPMIVTLRTAERTCEDAVVWWAGREKKPGQAQRLGYIVIAPDYTEGRNEAYKYDMRSHEIVLAAIRDARKRFRVDSDRIFLTGHGSGGDAAFDIGMSHPHLFAGVIPIAAIAEKYCRWYWPNSVDLPFYIVSGELCRDSPHKNARILNSMMRARHDVIYVEYVGRGYESYYEEIHRLFEWMKFQQRKKYPTQFEMKLMRPSESEFYWLNAKLDSSDYKDVKDFLNGQKKRRGVRARKISVSILPNRDRIRIRSLAGAKSSELWLAPELVDFDRKLRVVVSGNRTAYFNFVTPDIEALLEDFRIRGDREKTFLARIRLR